MSDELRHTELSVLQLPVCDLISLLVEVFLLYKGYPQGCQLKIKTLDSENSVVR